MTTEAIRIVGFAALFAVVYAILYRPVLGMLENRDEKSEGLSDRGSGQEVAEQAKTRIPWHRDRIMLSVAAAVFIADQVTKYIVKGNLALYESWPREGLVRVTYGTNSGTAFGLFPNQTLVLIVTSLLAIGFIYYFYRSHEVPGRVLRLAIGLQLGGAFGNLVDRVRLGSVVDFIDIGWWPIFNLADSSIVTGIGLLALIIFFTPREREDTAGESPHALPDAPAETVPHQPDARDDPHVQG